MKQKFLDLFGRLFHLKVKIYDGDHVYRRLHPREYQNGHISSGAFTDIDLSVNLARLISAAKTILGYPGFRVAMMDVQYLRKECGLDVIHQPMKDEFTKRYNYSHSLVLGKKNRTMAKKIGNHSFIVI